MSKTVPMSKGYLEQRERNKNRKWTTVVIECLGCGEEVPIRIDVKDYEEYLSPNRRHIQDIFPYLTPVEREMFISRLCPECWEDMFSDYDEDYAPTPEDLKEWQDASCGLV